MFHQKIVLHKKINPGLCVTSKKVWDNMYKYKAFIRTSSDLFLVATDFSSCVHIQVPSSAKRTQVKISLR